MKKPTRCRAKQKCEECRALVPKDDTQSFGEFGVHYDYYFECAFGHTKSEYLYHNYMNQWNKLQEQKNEEETK